MDIKTICVVGGGKMGRQIAMTAAIHGVDARVYDLSEAVCNDVKNWAEDYLNGRVLKGRLTENQVQQIKTRFYVERDMEAALKDVDCVIEAIIEVENIKKNVLQKISELVNENTVIATNSSFMVSSLFAESVKNPSRLCNMHFYNPALVMKFVEVVQGPHTSTEAAEAAYNFCKKIGKTPIWEKKEIPGFAGNFMIEGLHERARYLVEHGYCTYEEVDIAMEEGFNHPMGPFRLLDFNGVNLSFDIMKRQYEETGVKCDMYDVFEKMTKEGKHGRATGQGFYKYK